MLEIKNLTKSFDRPLFKNISMSFQEKGMYVIVGQSGCGKSTLLNILGGLDQQYQGTIEIDGKDIRKVSHYIRKYIGFIFQQFYLVENISVKENENLITYFKKIITTKKEKYLKRLKIEKLQCYKTSILSGGQKQRVAIYRAFIAKHPIILCDEPTGALDTKNSEEVFKILQQLAKEKLVIVISHDEILARKYHDYLYEIKDCQLHLIHQNTIHKEKNKDEKTYKKTFFHFLLKELKMTWKGSFIVVQVLFLALLSILLTLSLTQSTNKQIHEQLEQIIPSTTIMLKKKDNQMLTLEDIAQIQHQDISYRFLQNNQIDFLGISTSKNYQTKKTLYISDYIQETKNKIEGKMIQTDQEVILSKSTYDQLLYLSKKKDLINKEVYLFFEYLNQIKAYKVKIVGIENKETVMETIYFNEYAMSHMIKELYQIEKGQTAFLQVKNKKVLKDLKNKYPRYQFKLANSSLSTTIDEKFQQIEWILICFSSLAIITACFLLGIVLYLTVIKRKKYFAILQTLGASKKQIIFIVLFQGMWISYFAFIEAYLILKQLFILANMFIQRGISNLIEEFFTIPNDIVLIVFIAMCALIFICSLIPIKKVQQIEIIDALKS